MYKLSKGNILHGAIYAQTRTDTYTTSVTYSSLGVDGDCTDMRARSFYNFVCVIGRIACNEYWNASADRFLEFLNGSVTCPQRYPLETIRFDGFGALCSR